MKKSAKISVKKVIKKSDSIKAVKKAPELISGADLVAAATKQPDPKFIKSMNKLVSIKFLSWPEMVELQAKVKDSADLDLVMMAYAYSITEKEVAAIKKANGRKYAELLGAMNGVYGATNEDVKKQ